MVLPRHPPSTAGLNRCRGKLRERGWECANLSKDAKESDLPPVSHDIDSAVTPAIHIVKRLLRETYTSAALAPVANLRPKQIS